MAMTRREKPNPEIPTGTMADMVFLLLVFFLVTTTMNQDKGIGMQLPPAGESKKIQKKNICNIWINVAGEILINLEDNVPLAQLRANLQQRLKANDKLIISLKADEETSYDKVISVLDKIKLAGATRISLASPEH
ncbi:MAG: biopolymer transporter ExbD [bacterium]|jgi:biopolymer transport protein ExbD|nr:biopolymer transporter ExbD [bacterium]